MKILCYLEFSEDGKAASIVHAENNRLMARFKVFGRFQNIAVAIDRGFYGVLPFCAVAQGVSDSEFVDENGDVREK